MARPPQGFDFTVDREGTVTISHHGRKATVLRGDRALAFREDVENQDAQELMARLTGNYRRGNERTAADHPRNRRRPT